MIQPIGHRALVVPDKHKTETASGLVTVADTEFPATTGRIVALGPKNTEGSWNARQRAVKDCLKVVEKYKHEYETQRALGRVAELIKARIVDTPDPVRPYKVGDRVAFASESGMEVREGGTDYILLWEDDIVALVEDNNE